jgi:hypothetical protein
MVGLDLEALEPLPRRCGVLDRVKFNKRDVPVVLAGRERNEAG